LPIIKYNTSLLIILLFPLSHWGLAQQRTYTAPALVRTFYTLICDLAQYPAPGMGDG